MGFLSSLGLILEPYMAGRPASRTEPGSSHQGDVEKDFDRMSREAPHSSMSDAFAEAFRSKDTPPFATMVAQLFQSSSPAQRASLISTLVSTAGPVLMAKLAERRSPGAPSAVTSEDVQNLSPEEVERIAAETQQKDPSIVDRVSQIYSAQPELFKTLGQAALMVALAHAAKKRHVM